MLQEQRTVFHMLGRQTHVTTACHCCVYCEGDLHGIMQKRRLQQLTEDTILDWFVQVGISERVDVYGKVKQVVQVCFQQLPPFSQWEQMGRQVSCPSASGNRLGIRRGVAESGEDAGVADAGAGEAS